MVSTFKKRAEAAAQANANAAIEGFVPDQDFLDLQDKFVSGEMSLEDMLAVVRAQAIAESGGAESVKGDQQ